MRPTAKELEDLEKEARGADGQGWPRTILDLFDTIRALEAELAAALAESAERVRAASEAGHREGHECAIKGRHVGPGSCEQSTKALDACIAEREAEIHQMYQSGEAWTERESQLSELFERKFAERVREAKLDEHALICKECRTSQTDNLPVYCDRRLELMREVYRTRHADQPAAPLCADCGHPESDSRFHLEAPGTNWGAALHHFRPQPAAPTPTVPVTTAYPQQGGVTYPVAAKPVDTTVCDECGKPPRKCKCAGGPNYDVAR